MSVPKHIPRPVHVDCGNERAAVYKQTGCWSARRPGERTNQPAHAHTVPTSTPSGTQSTPSTCESCHRHAHISGKSLNICQVKSAGAWRLPTAFFGCWQSHVRLASSQSTSALAESALARLASAQTQYSHWTVVSHERSMQGPSTSGLARERAVGCGRRYNAAEQHLRCNCDPHSNDPQSSTRPTRTPLLVSASGE